MVRFGILGPIELSDGERRLSLGGPRQLRLLAFLMLHANRAVSNDQLIDALWGEHDPAGASKRLQVAITRLRKALGGTAAAGSPRLRTVSGGYLLSVAPGELDADVFRARAEEGRRALEEGDPARAAAVLREALALWRGPVLAELAYEEFAQAEIQRLDELRLSVLEARVDADLRLGRHAQVIGELQQLVTEHPWRERLHGQLMLALYRGGRQTEALAAYRRAREGLVEQLALEPGSELRELERAILTHDPALDLASSGKVAGREPGSLHDRSREAPPPARIPLPPTATIGRQADLVRLRDLLREPGARLVTVVGPGGVGKTRLAVELGRAVAPGLADGARFVSLAGLDSHEHVASTIARELDVALQPAETVEEALARYLHERQLLLVLDNFEHVLGAAPLAADLLAGAPELIVLATSREPLRLRAERLYRLDPLALPEINGDTSEAPAVALFVAVARARDPAFALKEGDARGVSEVCRRLDGLPLAIELAASRLGLLSVAELAARLRNDVGGLGSASRDAPARQRTLTATLEWSFALLTPHEQAALTALAVFAGGCTLDAAETVPGASVEVLQALVDKNLLAASQLADGSGRVTMLATVREFARARLAQRPEAGDLYRRHCEYFVALAERSMPVLRRSDAFALVAELDRELDNARAALTWALERPAPVLALRLATALHPYWGRQGLDVEASRWLGPALGMVDDAVPASVRAAALDVYADSLASAGTYDRAEAAARQSLELRRSLGDPSGCAESLRTIARVMMSVHRAEEAYRYASDAERLAREIGNQQTRVDALVVMAMMAPSLDEALVLQEQAAVIHRATGNRRRLADVQSSTAYAALCHGDHAAAERLAAEALQTAEVIGDQLVVGFANGNTGLVALLSGELERAADAFTNELHVANRMPFKRLQFEALNGLAAVAAAHGRDELAAQLSGAADATCLDRHDPVIAQRLDDGFFAPARARLGLQTWQKVYAAGSGLGPEQALELAQHGSPAGRRLPA